MENEILKEILSELKEHSTELKDIKKSVKNLENDIKDIKILINKGIYVDMEKLENKLTKRIEALERKIG